MNQVDQVWYVVLTQLSRYCDLATGGKRRIMKSKMMLEYLGELVALSIGRPPREVGALRYTR